MRERRPSRSSAPPRCPSISRAHVVSKSPPSRGCPFERPGVRRVFELGTGPPPVLFVGQRRELEQRLLDQLVDDRPLAAGGSARAPASRPGRAARCRTCSPGGRPEHELDEVQPELARRPVPRGRVARERAWRGCARAPAGTLVLIDEIGGTTACCTFFTVWKSVSPRKRRCPARSSHRMMPTAKMSVRASTSCPIAASGDR